MNGKTKAFTLIELLVVMSIIALLLTLAMPRYFKSLDHSKEAALKQDLSIMRDALDKFYGDHGKYPDTLNNLIEKHYLREIPKDPITESSSTWVLIPPSDITKGNVYDVKSGAPGQGSEGVAYNEW